jgi:antitoxin (DNA-binding transcriptional repressor) of toxin-antitoxin stability system
MATIDASRITRAVLRDLQAGRPVKLTQDGKAIAALPALPLRPRFDPAVELAAIRKADKGDGWADFLAWPA